MINDTSIQHFLDELASKAPTPGGGSAAAIIGAMGAGLVSMVCNLTLGKKGYEAVEADMRATLDASESLRARLSDTVRADVEAFDRVMGAYRLPKETDADKQARSEAIQAALKAATDVPLACAKDCAELIQLSRTAAEKGNRNVISDAGVAVLAAYAALKSAALNVYVNTSGIKDEAFAQERISELNAILTGAEVSTEEIYQEVKNKL
ncbi:methenyltetrahydrofolate cyclohydrolase [Methyloterricola oryzae]|uniref:methenyltetrahydrofolate cyclohydrolase n=1 Tax=Methyloterricola oryzae TaxID=1495050 RepID=UPI0005EBE763|nr:methenyltetrahydrofolate cyclohydrolase [Methyloterricola oryzae]